MKTSESIKAIAPALLVAQKAIGAAIKGAVNPFYKKHYADMGSTIEAVKVPLNDAGIIFTQCVNETSSGDGCTVETSLIHQSGEWISSNTPVRCAKPNDPQAMGIGITYAKRYALTAICGLPTKDDDGEGAMTRNPDNAPKPPMSTPSRERLGNEAAGAADTPKPTPKPKATMPSIKDLKLALLRLVARAKGCTVTEAGSIIGGHTVDGEIANTVPEILDLAGKVGQREALCEQFSITADGELIPNA